MDSDVSFEVIDLYTDDFCPTFNQHDLKVVREGHDVDDQIKGYQDAVDRADGIVFVTPIYWWSLPAMLKGWFDRTLTPGWAYDVVEGGTKPLLRDRPALVLALDATDEEAYERHGYKTSIQQSD